MLKRTVSVVAFGGLMALSVSAASSFGADVVAAQPNDVPARGVSSQEPAKVWEFAFVSGNGRMGAMVFGDPAHETIIANHCRLFAPLGSREIVPDLAKHLPELRRVIREQGYGKAMDYFLGRAKEQGFPGIMPTDPFHPGFFVNVRQEADGPISDYVRTENFETGEIQVRWRDAKGMFSRRLFVSRTANVIAFCLIGPKPGGLNCELQFQPAASDLVEREQQTSAEWVTYHNVYARGKGGYDAVVRIVARGGQTRAEGDKVRVSGAEEVLLLMRIVPWKTPLPKDRSNAWAYSPDSPDFAAGRPGVYEPSPALAESSVVAYRTAEDASALMPKIKESLAAVPADYAALLAPHAKAHGGLFNRVTLDLGGGEERNQPTEALLDLAAREKRLPAALLEKMFDAGRYMFICSAGELPPNLQGIWTGTWRPAWSGDFTLDTNLQAAVGSGLSANMLECMEGYFRLIESFVPDCRENARKIYGCRGILTNSRASNNCLMLHWGGGWPGQFWTAGAGWLAHWFYDYYLYTGDRDFLSKRTVPLLKEIAAFYEDFLWVDETGKYRFSPSFSPETEMGDNATMDIAVTKEVLTNLVAACEELGVEKDGVARWKAMLAKMPPCRVNEQGELSEWALPGHREHYGHRHHAHLYPVFQSHEFTPEETPELWEAAKAALRKKIDSSGEQSSFGRMQAGLAAAYLGMAEEAFGRLAIMAVRKSMYPSLITSHEPGQGIFNTDANGSIPELVNSLLVFSRPGRLDLLPALPQALPRGSLSGILARGQIKIDRLAWDKPAGKITLDLTSGKDQTLTLGLRQAAAIKTVEAHGAEVKESARGANCREVSVKAGRTARLELAF